MLSLQTSVEKAKNIWIEVDLAIVRIPNSEKARQASQVVELLAISSYNFAGLVHLGRYGGSTNITDTKRLYSITSAFGSNTMGTFKWDHDFQDLLKGC